MIWLLWGCMKFRPVLYFNSFSGMFLYFDIVIMIVLSIVICFYKIRSPQKYQVNRYLINDICLTAYWYFISLEAKWSNWLYKWLAVKPFCLSSEDFFIAVVEFFSGMYCSLKVFYSLSLYSLSAVFTIKLQMGVLYNFVIIFHVCVKFFKCV